MIQQLIEMMKMMLEQDELFELGAQATKKSYDALREVGFTEDQALQIVAHQGSLVKSS